MTGEFGLMSLRTVGHPDVLVVSSIIQYVDIDLNFVLCAGADQIKGSIHPNHKIYSLEETFCVKQVWQYGYSF